MQRLLFIVIATAVAGCGNERVQSQTPSTPSGNSGSSGTGTAAAQSAKTWCDGITGTLTSYYARCFGGTAEQWRAIEPDPIECTTVEAQVRDALLSFNASKASDCSRAVAATSCGRTGLNIESCESTLAGAISAGESCSDSSHCVDGTRCIIPENSCSGSCTLETRAVVGESCADTRCTEGLFCFYDGNDGSRICKASGDTGAACTSTFDCIDTLWCDGATCGAPKPAGAACEGGYRECAGGLVCAGPQGAQACRQVKKIGEACTPGDEECVVGHCSGNSICVFDAALGQMCGPDGPEEADCQRGYCSAETGGTCQARKAIGAACERPDECDSYDCSGGVCQAPQCP